MMRNLLLITLAAVAAAAILQPKHTSPGSGIASPSRTTVITKNSDLPRLDQKGLANRHFNHGQWI